jgi:hypothetical protein
MASRRKALNGKFTPTNPGKYVGTYPIVYRSTWELAFMRMADKHSSVISWASESIRIPYLNPVTRKGSMYVPDFLMVYEDSKGNRHQELIEVKPASQTFVAEAKSRYDKVSLAINAAKWKAAASWCKKHGLTFKIINESDIFVNHKR